MQWSGSRTKQAKHFKANLAKALDDLKAVGALNSYAFSGDLVTIYRTPSGSQLRYLTLTRARPRKK